MDAVEGFRLFMSIAETGGLSAAARAKEKVEGFIAAARQDITDKPLDAGYP